jgi:hypothetical protein
MQPSAEVQFSQLLLSTNQIIDYANKISEIERKKYTVIHNCHKEIEDAVLTPRDEAEKKYNDAINKYEELTNSLSDYEIDTIISTLNEIKKQRNSIKNYRSQQRTFEIIKERARIQNEKLMEMYAVRTNDDEEKYMF